MQLIENRNFGGERPLFATKDAELVNVVFEPGESALKCCRNLNVKNCRFQGKYPFWEGKEFVIEDCDFEPGARAAIWYSDKVTMRNCRVDAPKMFREMQGLTLRKVKLTDAAETLWHCTNIELEDVEIEKADYLFMHSANIRIDRYRQQGNYSFQYCRNVVISNADIDSKDAFWNTENVTVYDSKLTGEYLGWHSHGLKLVNCHISGTQPLCYAHDLVLENCTFDADADLAFEDSEVTATIASPVTSIKNPRTGSITLPSVGTLIIDENLEEPGDCRIVETDKH